MPRQGSPPGPWRNLASFGALDASSETIGLERRAALRELSNLLYIRPRRPAPDRQIESLVVSGLGGGREATR